MRAIVNGIEREVPPQLPPPTQPKWVPERDFWPHHAMTLAKRADRIRNHASVRAALGLSMAKALIYADELDRRALRIMRDLTDLGMVGGTGSVTLRFGQEEVKPSA